MGERRLKQLANKYGRWLTISSEDIDRAKGWFNRHGGKAVLIGRIVPGIRTLISVPAGMSNMPLLPFLFYTTLGSAAWVALLTYSRYWLGIQYELVQKYLAPVSKIVLGGLLVVFLLWVLKRQSRETRR
ncbi:SNARE associated Golgi protein-like protein [Sphaerospermopsis kisseleviana NIES-73]|nr:SNARE associated Golgi protein-like protein [Sphaerospermopsis kisseleviana NIES-73]